MATAEEDKEDDAATNDEVSEVPDTTWVAEVDDGTVRISVTDETEGWTAAADDPRIPELDRSSGELLVTMVSEVILEDEYGGKVVKKLVIVCVKEGVASRLRVVMTTSV